LCARFSIFSCLTWPYIDPFPGTDSENSRVAQANQRQYNTEKTSHTIFRDVLADNRANGGAQHNPDQQEAQHGQIEFNTKPHIIPD